MPNQPLRRGGRGGFARVGSGGPVPNKPLANPGFRIFVSVELWRKKLSGISIYFVSVVCCCGLCVPNMIITKANAKQIFWGNVFAFPSSHTNPNAKSVFEIFACSRFRAYWTLAETTASGTKLSESFGPRRVLRRELRDFLSLLQSAPPNYRQDFYYFSNSSGDYPHPAALELFGSFLASRVFAAHESATLPTPSYPTGSVSTGQVIFNRLWPESNHSGNSQERGSGGVQSTGVSQRVRATRRDESQSVPSPEKLFETRDSELPFFEGSLPNCSPHSVDYTRTFLHLPRCQNSAGSDWMYLSQCQQNKFFIELGELGSELSI